MVEEIIKLHPEEKMKFYRVLAVESARFAAAAREPSIKKSFHQIAMQWTVLAARAEAEAQGSTLPANGQANADSGSSFA
jgi:hypothetical protein